MNAWEKKKGMYHRGVIVAWCVVIINGVMWVCWRGCVAGVRYSDPIKPRGIGVVWLNNSLVTFLSTLSIITMSLINNRVFERSMGHRISRGDARFHLHTSDGQHYPSNQQVRSCHWGQRGYNPGGKLRVFWEFLNNIPSICPLGILRIFWRFISQFDLKKPSG